jgi:hypothetical protein
MGKRKKTQNILPSLGGFDFMGNKINVVLSQRQLSAVSHLQLRHLQIDGQLHPSIFSKRVAAASEKIHG